MEDDNRWTAATNEDLRAQASNLEKALRVDLRGSGHHPALEVLCETIAAELTF
jgi:hypothetical protein